MRWFALFVALCVCLVGLIAGQIAYNRKVPTRGGFDLKLLWATEEIPMAMGSGAYSYLRFGFDIDNPEKSEAEIKRRVMALEPYVKTPDELRDWLSRASMYFKYDELVALEKRYKGRVTPDVKMLILSAKCSNGMGASSKAETRERLGRELWEAMNQDFSGSTSSDFFRSCLVQYFDLCSDRGEFVADYRRFLAKAPKDPAWVALLDDVLICCVPQEVYLHKVSGLILDEFSKTPGAAIQMAAP